MNVKKVLSITAVALSCLAGAGAAHWAESRDVRTEFVPAATPPGAAPIHLTYSGAGVFRVPAEFPPGTYMVTAGAGDFGCYWERLRSFDNRKASVLSSGDASRGGYGRLVVTGKDLGVRMVGDCVWVRL